MGTFKLPVGLGFAYNAGNACDSKQCLLNTFQLIKIDLLIDSLILLMTFSITDDINILGFAHRFLE